MESLGGKEKLRSIQEACSILEMDLTVSKQINIDGRQTNTELVSLKLKTLNVQTSNRIKEMRGRLCSEYTMEKKLEKLKERNPD